MKGRKPLEYKLIGADRRYLNEVLADGQLIQRIANRARALLALDCGERIFEIVRWIGLSRKGLWYLWKRYEQRGVEAIYDDERSGGDLAIFPPLERVQIERIACTDPAVYGLHLSHWDCRSLGQVVLEQALVSSIHFTTVARILAEAKWNQEINALLNRKNGRISSKFHRVVLFKGAEISWFHLAGNKPKAVQKVVELTGAGLKVSKDYVDSLAKKIR
jgi:hypothetical protein